MMTMVMTVSKGRIRQIKFSERASLATTTNSLGWEVQAFRNTRWTSCTQTMKTEGTAHQIKDELERLHPEVEFRVYEALAFPPHHD